MRKADKMAVMQNYYKVLGVSPKASEGEIKIAYRKLAKQYHPDIHPGDLECEKKFREINEAYGILGDAEKRKQYDAERGQISRGAGTDFSNFQRGFENFFGFQPDAKRKNCGSQTDSEKKNPLDTTDLFERFMGIKR